VARTGEDDVRLVLRRAARIRLEIVAPEGETVERGSLFLLRPGPQGYVEVRTSSVSRPASRALETGFGTLGEGELFRVLGVVFHRAGGRYAPFAVDVVAGDGEPTRVHLEPGRALRGLVAREDGRPVAGAQLRVRAPRQPGVADAFHFMVEHGHASSPSGPDGQFELRGIPADVAWITCEAPGLAQRGGPLRVDPADREVGIVMTSAREVSGRVVGDAPLDFQVEWRSVELAGDAGAIALDSVFAGADGFFAFRDLGPGAIRIDAWRPWDREDDRYAQLDAVRAGTTGLRLPAVQGTHIEGFVRDAVGDPVPDAVALLDAPWGTRRGKTDVEGRFVLNAVPPGRHVLHVVTAEPVVVDAPGPPVNLVR
jgi:hypothetical protein